MKKGVIKNFAKFTTKHLCQSLIFNKVAGLSLWILRIFQNIFFGELLQVTLSVLSELLQLLTTHSKQPRRSFETFIFSDFSNFRTSNSLNPLLSEKLKQTLHFHLGHVFRFLTTDCALNFLILLYLAVKLQVVNSFICSFIFAISSSDLNFDWLCFIKLNW